MYSNPVKGHILYYKTEEGNWIPIPVLVGDIYTAYVQYCEDNNIEAVDKHTYYSTVGSLQSLVTELSNSSENINALTKALEMGALPQTMGGLGVTIGAGAQYNTLADALVDEAFGVCVVLKKDIADLDLSQNKVLRQQLSAKEDVSMFASGTTEPNSALNAKYYFQYS